MIQFRQRDSVNIGLLLLTSILSSTVDLENQCLLCAVDMVEEFRVLTVEVLDFLIQLYIIYIQIFLFSPLLSY